MTDSVNDQETPDAGADADTPSPLDALRQEKDALQDRLLRTAAEFDNYRKRIDRERREQADSAAFDLLFDLLPIVDDLERALEAPTAGEPDAYRRGVELIHIQMLELLRRRFSDLSFQAEQHTFQASFSCGIACFPHDGNSFSRLYQLADMALYQAKGRLRPVLVDVPVFVINNSGSGLLGASQHALAGFRS